MSWPRSPNLSPDKGREVKLAHINDDGDNLDFPSDDRRASCEVKLVDPAQAQTSLTAEIHFDVEKLDVTREDGKGGTPSRLNDSGSFPLPQTLNFRLGKQVSENVLATVFVVETINGKEGSAPRRYLRAVQTITCRAPYAKKGWAVRFFKSDPDLPIHSEPEGPYTAFWLPPSTLSDGDPQPLQLTPRLTFPEGKLPSKVLVQCFYPDPMAPGTGPLASRDERNWHSLATTKEFAPPDMVPGGIREVSLSFSTATPAGQQPVAEVPNIDVKRGIRFVVREAGAKQQQQPLADILMMPRFWTHVAFVKKGTLDPRMGPAPPGRVHFDIEAAAPPSAGEASLLPPKFNVTIDPKRIDSRVLRKGDKKLRAELGFGGTDYLFFDIDREQLEKALEPGKNSHFEFSANIDAYSHAYRFRFSDANQIEPVPVPHVRIAEPMPYDVLVLPDDSQKGKKVVPHFRIEVNANDDEDLQLVCRLVHGESSHQILLEPLRGSWKQTVSVAKPSGGTWLLPDDHQRSWGRAPAERSGRTIRAPGRICASQEWPSPWRRTKLSSMSTSQTPSSILLRESKRNMGTTNPWTSQLRHAMNSPG